LDQLKIVKIKLIKIERESNSQQRLRQGRYAAMKYKVYILLMLVLQTIPYDGGTFFITFTCHNWLPLIDKQTDTI
jgi:hypothetical protein